MTIDTDGILLFLAALFCAVVYLAIGAIFADSLSLTGFAWFGAMVTWPFVITAILMAFGLALWAVIGIIKAVRGDA